MFIDEIATSSIRVAAYMHEKRLISLSFILVMAVKTRIYDIFQEVKEYDIRNIAVSL